MPKKLNNKIINHFCADHDYHLRPLPHRIGLKKQPFRSLPYSTRKKRKRAELSVSKFINRDRNNISNSIDDEFMNDTNLDNRSRSYSDDFSSNSTKVNQDDKIFDYLCYLESINKTDDETYKEYKLFKQIATDIHYRKYNVVRLQDDSYVKDSSYQNIKVQLDGFDEDGNLIYIIPFSYDISEVKINNVSMHYVNYIQTILNIFNIPRCIIHVYSFQTFPNTRMVRRSHQIEKGKYGWLIDEENNHDIYYIMQHDRKNVIEKSHIDCSVLNSLNNQIISINIDKYTTPVHKKRRNNFLDSSWIAASKTRNASLNDHFLDYCRVYNVRDIEDTPEKRSFNFDPSSKYERKGKLPHEATSFIDFLLTSGNNFEDNIVKKLKAKYPNDFVKICDSFESRNVNNYKKTLEQMNKGIPIIHQAVIYSYKHKVFGSADLLVRSDWLNRIVKTKVVDKSEINIKANKLQLKKYHYRVIDIKFHKIHLNADAKTLRNNGSVKPFKNQLAIYNIALGEMQGYTPPHSYILGKGWILTRTVKKKIITKRNNDPFNKFGIIDFGNRDNKYTKDCLKHVKWLRELDSSTGWTHDPPSNDKLYPNMCNKMDGIYSRVKRQVAKKYKDITQIWNCSYVNRLKAFDNGVLSWDDPRCCSKIMGITGPKKSKMIDHMIKFHRDTDKLISVGKIKHNHKNWRGKNKVDIFIDFETIGTTLLESHDRSNIGGDIDFIFMIGIGWQLPHKEEWNYKCLFTKDISVIEERRILEEMNNMFYKLEGQYGINNIYHWSKAEPVIYNKANKKYGYIFPKIGKWFDLLDFFKENEIFLKKAYSFGLKAIASQMSKYGMIESDWNGLNYANGLDAMYQSWKLYVTEKGDDIFDNDIYQGIIDYNEIDCKTLFEILNYFRKYH